MWGWKMFPQFLRLFPMMQFGIPRPCGNAVPVEFSNEVNIVGPMRLFVEFFLGGINRPGVESYPEAVAGPSNERYSGLGSMRMWVSLTLSPAEGYDGFNRGILGVSSFRNIHSFSFAGGRVELTDVL